MQRIMKNIEWSILKGGSKSVNSHQYKQSSIHNACNLCNLWTKNEQTNPILSLPKIMLTSFIIRTKNDNRRTGKAKNEPNSNPIFAAAGLIGIYLVIVVFHANILARVSGTPYKLTRREKNLNCSRLCTSGASTVRINIKNFISGI